MSIEPKGAKLDASLKAAIAIGLIIVTAFTGFALLLQD